MQLTKRRFLQFALAAPIAATSLKDFSFAQTSTAQTSASTPFTLAPLPYDYGALEPTIDRETMTLHHTKHHQTYVTNLNNAVANYPRLQRRTPEDLITNLNTVPLAIREAVRNNGGGHVNHTMFWRIMKPQGGGEPNGAIARVIRNQFGSFESFKTRFEEAGTKRFGSGWVWLARNTRGRFEITSTPNQDNPLMSGMQAVLGNDVWEHAYYLKYNNRRAEYLKAWWNVVNWDEINNRLRVMRVS